MGDSLYYVINKTRIALYYESVGQCILQNIKSFAIEHKQSEYPNYLRNEIRVFPIEHDCVPKL